MSDDAIRKMDHVTIISASEQALSEMYRKYLTTNPSPSSYPSYR